MNDLYLAIDAAWLARQQLEQGTARPLYVLERTSSTMELARRLWQDGAALGTTIIAAEQTQGRGRRGRRFVSPRGGLYMTTLTAPCGPAATAWRAGMVTALAARQAILSLGGPRLGFEWPNDLMLGERKVGGILLEWLELAGRRAVAIGIGLNVGPDPRTVDAAAAGRAGVLDGLPHEYRRERVAAALLAQLEQQLTQLGLPVGWETALQSLREAILERADRALVVQRPDGSRARGRPVDLRHDGALVLQDEHGAQVVIAHGEPVVE